MSFNLTKLSLCNTSVVGFLLAIMLLGGIYAFVHLGKREDSTFKIKSAVVTCQYPGATPEEVEQLVVVPMERTFRTLSAVYKITSEAHFGYARLVVELQPDTKPEAIQQLWDELRRKVDDVRSQLPEGVTTIDVADDFGDVYGLYYALKCDDGFTWDEMRDYTCHIERQLYTVDGVSKVCIAGEQPVEIEVVINPATLAVFDLTPDAIARAVSGQNSVVGLGVRRAGEVVVELSEGTTYSSIADIENQLLYASSGKQYRLGDIAEVRRNYSKPSPFIVKVDGRDAIAIAVATDPALDIVAVGDRVTFEVTEPDTVALAPREGDFVGCRSTKRGTRLFAVAITVQYQSLGSRKIFVCAARHNHRCRHQREKQFFHIFCQFMFQTTNPPTVRVLVVIAQIPTRRQSR